MIARFLFRVIQLNPSASRRIIRESLLCVNLSPPGNHDMTEGRIHYTLTPIESKELPGRILAILVECRAQHRRITGMQIAKRVGYLNDRKVRVAIGKLILKGYLIVASVRKEKGYFLAETQEEVNMYLATEFSRVKENWARIKAIQQNAARQFGPQMPLVLE